MKGTGRCRRAAGCEVKALRAGKAEGCQVLGRAIRFDP